MSYKLPMGPYHPGLEEPYKLEMICDGETISDAKLHIGFNFRGIEHLAETRNYVQVIALMERVCAKRAAETSCPTRRFSITVRGEETQMRVESTTGHGASRS